MRNAMLVILTLSAASAATLAKSSGPNEPASMTLLAQPS